MCHKPLAYLLLPPTSEVRGKVMSSVCLSTRERRAGTPEQDLAVPSPPPPTSAPRCRTGVPISPTSPPPTPTPRYTGTDYTTDGAPLAVTQEDFLVLISCCLKTMFFFRGYKNINGFTLIPELLLHTKYVQNYPFPPGNVDRHCDAYLLH